MCDVNSVTHFYLSEREQQRQHKRHYYSDDNLQGQSHFDVVAELVASGVHHKGVGRCGERRGKTHACAKGHGKQEGVGTCSYFHGRAHGDGSHEHGSGGVADKHGEQ